MEQAGEAARCALNASRGTSIPLATALEKRCRPCVVLIGRDVGKSTIDRK